jgi:hypothetical protein
MDLRHHVLAVHDDRRVPRRPERRVQDGPLFRDVDLLAAEHRIDPRPQPGLLCQPQKEIQRVVSDPILRIVEEQARRLGGQPLTSLRVLLEERPKMEVPDFLVVGLEGLPGRTSGQRRDTWAHCDPCTHGAAPFVFSS